jgi:hypothetical protein
LSNTAQLSIFDQPPPPPEAVALDAIAPAPGSFSPGTRIRITQAGPPLEHLNGQRGEIVSLMSGLALVKVEGIATAMMLRFDALIQWSPISEFTTIREETESISLVSVGDRVECDRAYVGQVGTVRRVGIQFGVMVAWVDYGDGKPWYPAIVESLSLREYKDS